MCLHFLAEIWAPDQYNYICTAVADSINPFSLDRSLPFPIFQHPHYPIWLAYQSNCTPKEEVKLFSSPGLALCVLQVGYPSSRLQRTDCLCGLCSHIAFAKGRVPSILHLSLVLQKTSDTWISPAMWSVTSDIDPPGHHLLISLTTLFCLFITILVNIS